MTRKAVRPGGHKKPRAERPTAQGNPARGTGIVAAPRPPVEREPDAHVYTVEKAMEICIRLVEGTSLNRITRDPHMPGIGTVYDWMRAHPEFAENYTRARLDQADTYADQSLEIADTPQEGIKTKTGPLGVETTEGDMIEHRRLQIETRKWFTAAMRPKRYGKSVDVNVGGQPDGVPIKTASVALNTTDPVEAARAYQEIIQGKKTA